jgi:hypothetical protein
VLLKSIGTEMEIEVHDDMSNCVIFKIL